MSNNAKVVMLMGMLSLISNYSLGSAKKPLPLLTLVSTKIRADQQYHEILTLPGVLEQIDRQLKANPSIKAINVLLPDNKVARIIITKKIKDIFLVDSVNTRDSQEPSSRFELTYKGGSLGNQPLIHPVLFRAISKMSSKPFPEVAAFPQLIAFLGQQAKPTMLADVLLSSVFQADPQLLQEALQVFVIMNKMGGILQNPVFLPILAQTLMSVLVHSGTGALPALLSPARGKECSIFSPIPRCLPVQILLRSLYSPSIMPLALCFPEVLAMAITGSELFSPGLPLAAILMPLLVEQFPAFAPAMEISQLLPILDPVARFLYRLRDQEQEAAIALVRAFLEVLLSSDLDELLSVLSPYPQALALELVARMLFQAACPSLESYDVLETLLEDAGMNNPTSEQLAMFGIQQLNAMMRDPNYSKLTDGHPLIGPLKGCYAVGISGGGRIVYAIDHLKKQVILVGMTPTHDYHSLESPAQAILNLLKK
jgi:hypothetical protein